MGTQTCKQTLVNKPKLSNLKAIFRALGLVDDREVSTMKGESN